jgi:hypothetical protein
MTSLTVVTHTCGVWNRDLTRCLASVNEALPKNAKHLVIELDARYENFQEARFEAIKLDEFIVFVDDDDYISKDSLQLCLQALEDTGAGLAFTDEVLVGIDGREQHHNCGSINYDMIRCSPQVIHHMAMMRTSAMSSRSIELARKYKCGIEWIMKADAASKGAIHVPIDGYFWVQHLNQHSRTPVWQTAFRNNLRLIGKELSNWNTLAGKIPSWSINRS